jgi:hypothetical protein
VEKLSLIVAFTSPRRGIEAEIFLHITEYCVLFGAEFAVKVNVARIAYGKDVVHWDGDSYDVGTTGKYDSDRNCTVFFLIASGVALSPLHCGHFWPIVPAPDDR